jgi:hypothetical protein
LKLPEVISKLLAATEFWSAVFGAIVGGFMVLIAQWMALRDARQHRAADQLRLQQTLAYGLLFKVIRIHTSFHHLVIYFQDAFALADREGLTGEPWQFVRPLANPPLNVDFSAEEMAVLLALKEYEIFNTVASLDQMHNSLNDAVRLLNSQRMSLTDRLQNETEAGDVLTGFMTEQQRIRLRPLMIDVNSLILQIRADSIANLEKADKALKLLASTLRARLGLTHKIENQVPRERAEPPAGQTSQSW